MTLLINIYVRDGIVMTADRRQTDQRSLPDGSKENVCHREVQKLHRAPSGAGVSTCGIGKVGGIQISDRIADLLATSAGSLPTHALATALLNDLSKLGPNLSTGFFVAGYDSGERYIWRGHVGQGWIKRDDDPVRWTGAAWAGEPRELADSVMRSTTYDDLTLGSAEALCIDVQRRTAATSPLVGGPFDVLVIKPGGLDDRRTVP